MTRRTWLTRAAALWTAGLHAADRKQQAPQALLFGTVFRESYLSLPGARVVAYNEARPGKKYRTVTNYRGEYRIRVPAGEATYVLVATAPKFGEARRTVEVYGIDKTTANLILAPRKNRKTDATRIAPQESHKEEP